MGSTSAADFNPVAQGEENVTTGREWGRDILVKVEAHMGGGISSRSSPSPRGARAARPPLKINKNNNATGINNGYNNNNSYVNCPNPQCGMNIAF